MHENEKNNAKGRVKQTYWLRERETLLEFWRKTTKKTSLWSLAESEREKKNFRKVLKRCLNRSKLSFLKKKKLDSRCSIDQKACSINQTRQRLTKIFQKDFNSSKIKLDQSKILKKKKSFQKNNLSFENIPQSIEYKK